jgi:CrcB protein
LRGHYAGTRGGAFGVGQRVLADDRGAEPVRRGGRYNAAMFAGFAAVGLGAALGAWLRWGLSTWLNPRHPHLPLGTLAANLIGGYAVGVAVAYFAARHDLPPEWRLFIVTGFLGGLTTFSTFSSEVTQLLLRGEYWTGASLGFLHLAGSLLLTIAGVATWRALTH